MAKGEKIGHEGIISNVSDNHVEVLITSKSACTGCHAKSACGLSSVKEKKIWAEIPDFPVREGEQVIVYATMGNAMFSVVMAYIIPVLIILSTIAVLQAFSLSELASAVGGIILTGCYYGILYLFRSKLNQKIKFTVEKQ